MRRAWCAKASPASVVATPRAFLISKAIPKSCSSFLIRSLAEAKAKGSLLEASEVADVVIFMLTRPRGMTIRDVVMMPTQFDL